MGLVHAGSHQMVLSMKVVQSSSKASKALQVMKTSRISDRILPYIGDLVYLSKPLPQFLCLSCGLS